MNRLSSIQVFRQSINELKVALLLLLLVALFGTLGYMLIEGWSVLDAMFMTMTTLSTVGFGEVHPLSHGGKIFTTALIVAGVGLSAYAFTLAVRIVVEGELTRFRRFMSVEKKIHALEGHLVICGYGRLAQKIVPSLLEMKQALVVIDRDPQAIRDLEEAGALYIEGNAWDDAILNRAGLDRASALLTLLPLAADNVYVTLSARHLNHGLKIIARSQGDADESKLLKAGANQVVAPYKETAGRLVQSLLRPNVSEFLEIAMGRRGNTLVLEEVKVTEGAAVCGKSLASLDLPRQAGLLIAAITSVDGQMKFNPGANHIINAGSTLIVLGDKEAVSTLSELVSVA